MSIIVKELCKKFNHQVAISNVSFSISKGITGFLGPNGAGKSTTMNIISGCLEADNGSVSVCGENIRNNVNIKRKIGYLSEQNPLYYDMYVKEFLIFSAKSYGLTLTKNAINQIIEITNLQPQAYNIINSLSKGYKQRVGLAQALLHNPEVLILDEATNGLDPNQIEEMRTLLRTLSETKTILFSTHILSEVVNLCSHVLIINKGRMVFDSTVDELINHKKNNVKILLEILEPITKEDLLLLPSIQKVEHINNIWHIQPMDNHIIYEDIRIKISQYAQQKNWTILSLSQQESSLANIFKSLTQ